MVAWDARLTSALVCWILYAAYLMLRRAVEEPTQRATFAPSGPSSLSSMCRS